MDKVSILTASRREPAVSINRHKHSDLIARLTPTTLDVALDFQRIVGSISFYLCLQAYFAAGIVASQLFQAVHFLVLHGLFAGLNTSWRAASRAWESKSIRRLRNKVFFEFAVFILGCGNSVFLVVFWPGWILLAALSLALWHICG
jgi:hypothetical protein